MIKKQTKAIISIAILALFALVLMGCGGKAKVYKIGDKGPGGGIVFYDKLKDKETKFDSDWRYLEGVLDGTELAWASKNFTSKNILGLEIGMGAGKANTALILAADPDAPAAKYCAEYRGGGFDDWFLPSSSELYFLAKNMPNVFPAGFLEFNWASDQYDKGNANGNILQKFMYVASSKDVKRFVPVIRAF